MSFTSDYLKKKEELTKTRSALTLPATAFELTQRASRMPQTDSSSEPVYTPGKKSQSGGAAVSKLPETKQTSRAKTLPVVSKSKGLLETLTTPAKNGYFEGESFLPSSPQAFAKGLGYHAERAGAGLLGAVEGVTDFVGSSASGIAAELASLGGQLNNPVSDWLRSQSESFLNTSPTQSWKNSINERYHPSIGTQHLGDITETVAQMLPALAVGNVVSASAPAIEGASAASKGAAASKALFGLQAAGAGAQQAALEGASTGQALTYGALSGLLETSIESLAGGIPGFGKGVLSEVADKVASNPLVARALDIVGEGGEEALSTIITPYIQRAVYNADAENATADEIAESAVMGMVAAGILQGGIELPTAVSQVMDTRRAIGTNEDIVNRVNQRLSQPGQVMSDFMNAGLSLPTVQQQAPVQANTPVNVQEETVQPAVLQTAAEQVEAPSVSAAPRSQVDSIPVQNRTWKDAGNRKVNAFQFDHPELRPYYAEAARALKYDLSSAVKGERIPQFDAEGYITGYTGTSRSVTEPIEQALDNAKLSYAQIDKALDDLIADNGQENYAAAKKVELVLDDMLTNGYTDSDGYDVPPNEAYIAARDQASSGLTGSEYRMSEEEWASLLENEPTNGLELPGGQDVNIQAVSPDSSVGAAPAENRTSPVRMSLDEYLGRRGLRAPFSDFMDDKLRLPHGETARQRVARERAANQAADDYQNRRAQAIREYQAAVESGEIVAPTRTERLLRIAQGNADNESVQAARRSLERRGINWRSEGDTGPLSLTLPGRPEDVYDIYGSGAENLPENAVGANKASPWAEFVASSKEFFPEGSNAAREVDMPTTDPQGRPIRKTAATALGARAIPEEALADIQNMVMSGQLSYDRVTDRASTARAVSRIQNDGFQRALADFSAAVEKGVVSKDLATLGQQLLVNAANAGDANATAELLLLYAQMETTAGQAVQAASILRKLSPTAQLYAAQKVVNNLNDTISKKLKGKDISIDTALIDEFNQQTTQEGRDAVMEKIYQNVADQVPSTWKDKWNALRYLSMLCNPRTHIRNIIGNVGFQPVRFAKDRLAAVIESGVSAASGGRLQRTKSFAYSPDLYAAAWRDFDNVSDVLSGNKYDDIQSIINDKRTIFKFKPLEMARRGNSNLLSAEDMVFKRVTYAGALAGYLNANGVTADQMKAGTVDPALLSAARDYAGQEALKATYNDRNAVSDRVVQIARSLGTFGEAVLPFKRTPANILVRGFEYSPLGLAKGLTYDLYQVKRGNMTGAEAIDHIASGLTGSALMVLGGLMAAAGVVTGGAGDDEKQAEFNELTGGQTYALNLPGGGSVTLDWLAPEALPFFMGVQAMQSFGEEGLTADTITSAFSSISEPMLEMSMLQSLNDLIDSVSFSDMKIPGLVGSALVSYLTQAIPTLGGQIERSSEDTRMSTYTDKNLPLPTDVQYALGRASSRIPGWDYQQIPYIDAWGRTESNGPLPLRIFNNFLNPAYTSQENATPLDEEIQRLYDDTGDNAVIPDRAPRYLTVGGERVDLNAEQYVQYATERGQTAFELGSDLIENDIFAGLTNQQKVNALDKVYTYADAMAKADVSNYEPEDWMKEVDASGVDPVTAILYRMSEADTDTKRKMLMDDDSLTASEKTALEEIITGREAARDYSSEEAFALSGLSDSGQEKWAKAEAWGMPYEDYVKFYPICAASGKGITKAVVIQNLIDAGMSRQDALNFWNLIRN